MVKQTITIRISYSSLKAYRKFFKANKNETMISYFDRLAVWLKSMDLADREAHGL